MLTLLRRFARTKRFLPEYPSWTSGRKKRTNLESGNNFPLISGTQSLKGSHLPVSASSRNCCLYISIASDSVGEYVVDLLEWYGFKDLAGMVNGTVSTLNTYISAFHIPGDFDDTSVNLALGVQLSRSSFAKAVFPIWSKAFYDFEGLAAAWISYAYNPLSTEPNSNNMIDPRTYFWLRGFLDSEVSKGTKSLLLIPTWAMNLTEDVANYKDGDKMPFNANNVDASVAANGIFGLTLAALNGFTGSPGSVPNWFSPGLQQLYGDTSRMLAWTINSDVLGFRPDLALLYYPPIYDFYWFVARTVHELSSVTSYPFPEMAASGGLLTDAMMNAGTDQILRRANTTESGGVFWDDFLGNNDKIHGKPLNRGEDRIFSTAVACSALIDTWTVPIAGVCQRSWRRGTPGNVQSVIKGAIGWLSEFTLSGKFALENAFFAGSMKSMEQGPWFFPANKIERLDGTPVSPTNSSGISGALIDSVQGYIPPAQYDTWLQQKWFGRMTPQKFTGYNAPGSQFPYWSSPTFTKSLVMLALAKYDAIERCQ